MFFRLYGAVTPVKDQSVCGSCWSFGSVGSLEGTLYLNTNKLVRLSQQALIDCSWGFGNNGCDGGEDFRVYQWMMKHGGIPTEDSYGPYLGQDGYCHLNDSSVGLKIKGWVNVTSGSVDALKVKILNHYRRHFQSHKRFIDLSCPFVHMNSIKSNNLIIFIN